jgi:hypothetical protein
MIPKVRTKKTKVSGVNYGFCIRLLGKIVERRETTTNVSNAKDSTMYGVEYFCLGINMVLNGTRKRRDARTGRSGTWTGLLHVRQIPSYLTGEIWWRV